MQRSKVRWPSRAWKAFAVSTGVMLAITGLAKLCGVITSTTVSAETDPIFGISLRHLMFAVGLLESAIALICFLDRRPVLTASAVAWLATTIVVYRLGLQWVGWRQRCVCLGSAADAVHLPPELADGIMRAALLYLMLGSYALLLWRWGRVAGSQVAD